MKQATITFIATQLITKEDKRELEKVFLHFDKNRDGRLSREEIIDGYEEYYGTPPKMDDIDKLFSSIDTDGSGTIDYTEFVLPVEVKWKKVKARVSYYTQLTGNSHCSIQGRLHRIMEDSASLLTCFLSHDAIFVLQSPKLPTASRLPAQPRHINGRPPCCGRCRAHLVSKPDIARQHQPNESA